MSYHHSIVVGVDGSRGSEAAVRFSAHEAHRLGADLRLVHVIPVYVPVSPLAPLVPTDLQGTGHAILAGAAKLAGESLPAYRVTTSLLDGPRVPALLQAAGHARMMALGHERGPTLDRLVTGATVTGVAAHARCPVVAVAPDYVARDEHACVLVGVKSTEHSPHLLRRGFEAAAERNARVLMVHAWEFHQEYDDLIASRIDTAAWETRARHAIRRHVAGLVQAYPEVQSEVRVVHGQPAHVLKVASDEADLMLLARRAHAFPLGHLGGCARALLRASSCPVAIVPPADEPDSGMDLVLEQTGSFST